MLPNRKIRDGRNNYWHSLLPDGLTISNRNMLIKTNYFKTVNQIAARNARNMLDFAYGFAIGMVMVVAIMVTLSYWAVWGNTRLYTIQSGSMSPTIPTGSIVFVAPENSYRLGDIITYKPADSGSKLTTTHRINQVSRDEQGVYYRTKGDANTAPDGAKIYTDRVIGKVYLSIPVIGYIAAFAKTELGLITLVVIPATVIVHSEVLVLQKELPLAWKKLQKRKKTSGHDNFRIKKILLDI